MESQNTIVQRLDRADPVYDIVNPDGHCVAVVFKEGTYQGGNWRVQSGLQHPKMRFLYLEHALRAASHIGD